MKDISSEVKALIDKYGEDIKQALQENSRLEYLYALSFIRENVLEWYPFKENASLLQVGSDYGALTGLFQKRLQRVVVLDDCQQNLEVNRLRHGEGGNVSYIHGSLEDLQEQKEQYDYVVFVGSLKASVQSQVRAAKNLLKQDGELIAAVCNKFGMKYRAGALRDENSFSKKELFFLLEDEDGCVECYYPMPDYKMPSIIYSRRYLPLKGDLAHSLPLYDYPQYLLMDVGSAYDEVCEDGQFEEYANSFLAVWKKGRRLNPNGVGKQIDLVKYNRTRKEEFQIKTVILQEDGKRYVEKTALCELGISHISSFEYKYQMLSRQNSLLKFDEPKLLEDGRSARFRYLIGETLAERLGKEISGGKAPVEAIQNALNLVFHIREEDIEPFRLTPEFVKVFGEVQGLFDDAYAIANIDALFENMLVTEEGVFCLDYEWVFSFPIPVHFVKYRTLYYFYDKYQSLMGYETAADFLKEFHISEDMVEFYRKMEESFQEYVHGSNQRVFQEDFMVKTKTLSQLQEVDQELMQARERITQLKAEVREKDTAIRKITEVGRLTNNHVTNLEIMIADLRRESQEQARLLTYLNRHEALVFKVRRKLGQMFNHVYPKGSVKRKKLFYKKEAVLHPLRSFQMFTTEEGKNRIEGDLRIGNLYRQHGKLCFPAVERPRVSIVIPVYNQIHYTYACLVSILEHTKDVSYEIIIADDVSTDATAQLERYVEHVKICRNTENQGFLRNCNQAARAAAGQYIMFLNNDTQVTAGWLSSLVQLIESDSSIGMVGSKLVYPDGRLQEAGGIIWSDGSGWNYGRLDNPDKAEYNYVKDVDYISGAAILLPLKLWNQIGGFDERFAPAYCEDSDLAFEVRKAGYRVVYQPLSKVIHFEGISNGTDVEGSGLKRYQVENSKKLKEKWAAEFAKQRENTGNPDPFRARERSMGKQMILVVDHYVPTYDRDAGSKTTFQYLKMFLEKGFVVKFLGDNFLHEEPYTTTLCQMGIEVLYGQDYQAGIWNWIKDHGKDISVAYLNRPHIASKYIDYILDNTDMKVIYYGHDLHFLRESREYGLTGDVEKRRAADYWKSIEFTLMRKAAVSYYPSSIERDAILEADPKIPVKAITAYMFEEFMDDVCEDFGKREGILFVGGFAHPPNADAVLWFARSVYPIIRESLSADFYVVGSKVTEEIKSLEQPGNGIRIKGFVSEEELRELYGSCRMVVVPLRYGAGVKGKVVEALYYGSPVVTTSVGAEGIPDSDYVMMIQDKAEDFAKAVIDVYKDEKLCRDLSRKGRQCIKDYYSVEAAWDIVKEDFS